MFLQKRFILLQIIKIQTVLIINTVSIRFWTFFLFSMGLRSGENRDLRIKTARGLEAYVRHESAMSVFFSTRFVRFSFSSQYSLQRESERESEREIRAQFDLYLFPAKFTVLLLSSQANAHWDF